MQLPPVPLKHARKTAKSSKKAWERRRILRQPFLFLGVDANLLICFQDNKTDAFENALVSTGP